MNTQTSEANYCFGPRQIGRIKEQPPVASPKLDTGRGIILYMEGVNKCFDGFKAINDLNLYIEDGELRCIIGPNGAGKSTMMDIITGKTGPDTGSVWFGQASTCWT